jgi:hypothetical protein
MSESSESEGSTPSESGGPMLSVEDQVHEKVTSLTLDPQVALAAEAPPKHDRYYFPDGNVVFLVRRLNLI